MKKKIFITFAVVIIILVVILGFAVNYLFNYAVVSGKKEFIKSDSPLKQEKKWAFSQGQSKEISILSDDGLKLSGKYIENKTKTKTDKVAVVAHGYMGEGNAMGDYAKIFYDLGYDVLIPDNRGHGKSEGKYVGFGWLDRLDYLKWLDEILRIKGKSADIGLFGVSMGASTVMMTSGESLPQQVKWLIADCGFESVDKELVFQLNDMFSLPAFPLIPLTSAYTKIRAGYSFYEASATKQLKKNNLPLLLIHGKKDDFVPIEAAYTLYNATKGPKQLEVFDDAKHATSFKSDPKRYKKAIKEFVLPMEN